MSLTSYALIILWKISTICWEFSEKSTLSGESSHANKSEMDLSLKQMCLYNLSIHRDSSIELDKPLSL